MSGELACDYVVVKYLANPLREEPRNIGVILRSAEGRYMSGRFVANLSSHLADQADKSDIGILESYVEDIEEQLRPHKSGEKNLFLSDSVYEADYLERLSQRFTGKLQFSQPRATIATAMDTELDRLFDFFVAAEIKGSIQSVVEKRPFFNQILAEFKKRALSARIGTRYPVKVKRQQLVFSFGYKPFQGNRQEVVLEAIDLRAQSFTERVRAFAPTSVKIEIAKNHRTALEAFCLVRRPDPKEVKADDIELELETLKRHADGVFDFDLISQRDKLFKRIENDLRV